MRIPAEWEHQSGVQLTWPHADTEWYALDKVLECYVDIAINITRFEPLLIVCRDIEEAKGDILRICNEKGLVFDFSKAVFCESPLNDTWARDHGGISVHGDDGRSTCTILYSMDGDLNSPPISTIRLPETFSARESLKMM